MIDADVPRYGELSVDMKGAGKELMLRTSQL